MKILAFDTSNQPLSVAIIENENIITEQLINIRRNHSIQLMPAIDEAFKEAELTISDIDRIAVASGPGSYTGLRIAVTIAKSLAWAKEIELVGISSLKVLASNILENNCLIVPIFDARRENIYTGLYIRDEDGNLVQLIEDMHVSAIEWADLLSQQEGTQKVKLVGSDASSFIKTFQEKLGNRVQLASPSQNLPRASILGFLAQNEEKTPAHALVPTYLKLAEAEENWLKEHPEFKGDDFVEKIK